MALEGSSLPFPGSLVVLAFGYLLSPDITEMAIIALGMSLTYSVFSYIAYAIGCKMEQQIRKRYSRPLGKAQVWFRRYGEWSIAFLRPFGLGNYISYIAGMSRVHPLRYGIYTIIGIYPWSLGMLWLGRFSRGNAAVIAQVLQEHQGYLLLFSLTAAVALLGGWVYKRHKKIAVFGSWKDGAEAEQDSAQSEEGIVDDAAGKIAAYTDLPTPTRKFGA